MREAVRLGGTAIDTLVIAAVESTVAQRVYEAQSDDDVVVLPVFSSPFAWLLHPALGYQAQLY